ncbi:Xylosyltransferase sqv-6 [Symbiodinium microadriaticum]|uniref:protein xylosyltransferase n=1 Tax=Symbiodinium microadriaticum TaxID=2951 RepID=A0A1Q9C9C4_SYMMI|nr:Xylosyltransferase sqv-6 [Symbiodinium microadriaticum]CAE7892297.1 sqv-6 [Symbiodinium microadriaticum]
MKDTSDKLVRVIVCISDQEADELEQCNDNLADRRNHAARVVLNVDVMEERFDVRRGGASFLLVLLRGLELLLESEKAGSWDYFINLNDNDYPITPVKVFQSFLQLHHSESFIHVGSPSSARCPADAGDCRKIDHLVVIAECDEGRYGIALLPSDVEMHRWFLYPTWAGPDIFGLWRPLAALA